MAKPLYAAGILLTALLALSCSGGFPPQFPAPDFSLESPLTGTVVTRADIQNRPAVMYWFTSW